MQSRYGGFRHAMSVSAKLVRGDFEVDNDPGSTVVSLYAGRRLLYASMDVSLPQRAS